MRLDPRKSRQAAELGDGRSHHYSKSPRGLTSPIPTSLVQTDTMSDTISLGNQLANKHKKMSFESA